jgi:hypothetical protein
MSMKNQTILNKVFKNSKKVMKERTIGMLQMHFRQTSENLSVFLY